MFDGIRLSDDSVSSARLNFRVEVQDTDEIRSLDFTLTGPVSVQRTLSDTSSNGLSAGRLLLIERSDQGNTTLTDGHYQITATPYAGADLEGGTGRSLSYSFVVGTPTALSPASSDATLSALSLSGVSFAFDSQTETYHLVYDGWLPVVTVSATATDDGAKLVIHPADATSAFDGHQVRLVSGMNTITVTVTAEDGSTTKTYTLNVDRENAFWPF